jgi:pilus assembly protein CpaE
MDAVNNLHRLDMSYWKAIVSAGMPGVEIIPSPTALASRQAPRDDQLRHVLGFVRPYYDWTIVDFGRSLTRLTMAALEEIDEACLVTTLEIPALHQAKQIVQALLDSGYGKNRIRLVLNRVPKRVDITPPELEKMMGLPIFAMIADDFAELYEAYAEGRLLARSSSLGKQIGRFGAKLAGLENGNGKKRFALFG